MSQEKKHEVLEYIERSKDELIDFARDYIRFESIKETEKTLGKELEAQNWLYDTLQNYGFKEIDKWTVDKKGIRPNLVAILRGNGVGKSLIFHGHTDVVPVDEQIADWTVDPFKGLIKDNMLWGRGAVDTKASNAGMVWAARALLESGVPIKGDLLLELVIGGEGGASLGPEGSPLEMGPLACVRRGYTADFAVVSEATNLEITTETGASFNFAITIPGKSVHSSCRNQVIFPQRYGLAAGQSIGVDPIEKSIPFIELFRRIERDWNFRWKSPIMGGGGFPIPIDNSGIGLFTITPTIIQGGTYHGSVATSVRILYRVWYPHWIDIEDIFSEIRNCVEALASTDDWLKTHPPVLEMPIIMNWKGAAISIENEAVQKLGSAYTQVLGKQHIYTGFRGCSAASGFIGQGIPAVTMGPGTLLLAHAPDERVPIDEVINYAKILAVFAIDWCG